MSGSAPITRFSDPFQTPPPYVDTIYTMRDIGTAWTKVERTAEERRSSGNRMRVLDDVLCHDVFSRSSGKPQRQCDMG